MNYDIITIGGATYDITLFPPKNEGVLIDNKKDILRQKLLAFEYGAKIKAEKIIHGFGGGAANAAVSFSKLGFMTAAIVAVGNDDFGRKIIANFKKNKVNAGLAQKIKNSASGLAIIVVGPDSAKDHTIFFDDKVKSRLKIGRKEQKALENTKWIYLASLSGNWQGVLRKIFPLKNRNPKIKIAWNPGQSQLAAGVPNLKNFLAKTEVFIVNLDEAIQLVISDSNFRNKNASFLNSAKNLLPILRNYGPKIIVITCGKNGAWAYDGEKAFYTLIVKEQKRVDTTGVGDAFGSSFVAGLELFNGDIKKAMKLGIVNTASVVAEPGAQNGLLSKKDLKKLKI